MRIAILEDDTAQVELLELWFGSAGHKCHAYTIGSAFQDALRKETYDLLIIDWNLPDTTGLEVLGWIRHNLDWHIPVLFTTSRDWEEDLVFALDRGADDYMIKPIKRAETLARVAALARRSLPGNEAEKWFRSKPYAFDIANRSVHVDGQAIELTHKEFALGLLLFRNAGRLLSRSYLLETVWGTSGDLNTRTVDTHISRVRRKLAIHPDKGWRLNAIYHHGYRLENLLPSGSADSGLEGEDLEGAEI
ncbi:MAG: response regulator transcription factor [Candidatus Polarisedimenticolaceae bacterium]|nr:response regulator transcription factor [Candidatus Polarisedimenticolaceae bacterium]